MASIKISMTTWRSADPAWMGEVPAKSNNIREVRCRMVVFQHVSAFDANDCQLLHQHNTWGPKAIRMSHFGDGGLLQDPERAVRPEKTPLRKSAVFWWLESSGSREFPEYCRCG
jgi:hypothetical protein